MSARAKRPTEAEVLRQVIKHRTDNCLHLNTEVLTLTDRRSGTEVVTYEYRCTDCPARWSG